MYVQNAAEWASGAQKNEGLWPVMALDSVPSVALPVPSFQKLIPLYPYTCIHT
jgi:hypothetical protein